MNPLLDDGNKTTVPDAGKRDEVHDLSCLYLLTILRYWSSADNILILSSVVWSKLSKN